MATVNVKIKRIGNGLLPEYKRDNDACMDCYAHIPEDITIIPGKRTNIPLGFALQLPPGYEVQIRPRSGLTKKGIDSGWGTGDEEYTGEYQATIINNSEEPFTIHSGDRICQMTIKPVFKINLNVVDELEETARGSNGFGSSGYN
mgnify:CR=1 FL=1